MKIMGYIVTIVTYSGSVSSWFTSTLSEANTDAAHALRYSYLVSIERIIQCA